MADSHKTHIQDIKEEKVVINIKAILPGLSQCLVCFLVLWDMQVSSWGFVVTAFPSVVKCISCLNNPGTTNNIQQPSLSNRFNATEILTKSSCIDYHKLYVIITMYKTGKTSRSLVKTDV